MTRIHAIYCGGCREAYARSEWLQDLAARLRQRVGDIDICYSPCPDACVRLILFGCQAACHKPEPAELVPEMPTHRIGPDGLFDGLNMTADQAADLLAEEIKNCTSNAA